MTDLTRQMEVLARRLDALEVENAQLREQLVDAESVESTEEPAESRRFGRRNLLRLGGAAAAIGAGSVLLRPGVAAAASGGNAVLGTDNDSGTDGTGLTSSNPTDTLHVTNTGTGEAIEAHISNVSSDSWVVHALQDGTSDAIVGEITNSGGSGAGVVGLGVDGGGVIGVSFGVGAALVGIAFNSATEQAVLAWTPDVTTSSPSLEANNDGKGIGAYVHNNKGTNTAAAVKGKTSGSGPGIDASSSKGVGGKFTGKTAQIQLVPSAASSHPATGGPGTLFVDKSKRLWYCKGGSSWKQLA